MKTTMSLILLLSFQFLIAQYEYEPSDQNPYGLVNPNAPKETSDFASLIGFCQCKSISRIDQNTWADTVMMNWTFKYIMNGMAVQDETLKADGAHSGSIRQYNADSAKWYVHYYSSSTPVAKLPTWEGMKMENENIVLYRDSPAPNGTPGDYRLTFFDLTEQGFNWVGEWVNKAETYTYPTWKIFCKRE